MLISRLTNPLPVSRPSMSCRGGMRISIIGKEKLKPDFPFQGLISSTCGISAITITICQANAKLRHLP